MTAEERFWSYVTKGQGCWLWSRSRTNGYGCFTGLGERRVHRISWVLHYGRIPAGFCVCHHCDTPVCVRPDHLFLGTNADNTRDAKAKGRLVSSLGTANGQAKLTPAAVVQIRKLHASGKNFCELGRRFGVSPWTVSAAVKRTQWKHVA